METWIGCAEQYQSPNGGDVITNCLPLELLSSGAHSVKMKGPVKWISMLMLMGAIVQTVLIVQ